MKPASAKKATRHAGMGAATLGGAALVVWFAFTPTFGHAELRHGRRAAPKRPRIAEADATKSATPAPAAWTVGGALPANAAALGLVPLASADAGAAPTLGDVVRRGKRTATVLVFISSRCPYVAEARPVLAALVGTWGAKVGFVGIASNQNEGLDELKAHAAARDFGSGAFVAYRDEKGSVAEALGAAHTPEVFVLDGDGFLRYHGGVQDLEAALTAIVAGKAVAKPESRAFGCTIKRRP
jgi:thiol-disulfide isomerase/thioredoxin